MLSVSCANKHLVSSILISHPLPFSPLFLVHFRTSHRFLVTCMHQQCILQFSFTNKVRLPFPYRHGRTFTYLQQQQQQQHSSNVQHSHYHGRFRHDICHHAPASTSSPDGTNTIRTATPQHEEAHRRGYHGIPLRPPTKSATTTTTTTTIS